MLRKKKLRYAVLILFFCVSLQFGCGTTAGMSSIVESTVDLKQKELESSEIADVKDPETSNIADVKDPESTNMSDSKELSESAADNQSVSAVELPDSSARLNEPEITNTEDSVSTTENESSGGNILAPSIVLKLSAGSILMEKSIDWNTIDDYFAVYEIYEGDEIYNRIIGKSYQVNENIGLSDLRYLKLLHYNFDGNIQVGELICNAALAEDMIDIFKELFYRKYQICSMHLIDNYWTGDGVESDEASIEVDNTSCFCYRRATDAENLSNHAYGRAIDINPLENPFYIIKPDGSLEYYHENAEPYLLNRDPSQPHVITQEDDAYRVFTEHGFSWGGNWTNPKDYQHFEKLS